jgi:hypothetical protein
MSFAGIASSAGTTIPGIEQLVRHGSGSPGLAATIGTTPSAINGFVNGQASADIAAALGASSGELQELRRMIGREGAIGLIIGLACGIGGSIGAAKPVAGKPAFDAQAAEAESAGAV